MVGFLLKEMKSNQFYQFAMLLCRIGYFPAKHYEIPPVLFSSSCAPFSGLLSLGRKSTLYTMVMDSFP